MKISIKTCTAILACCVAICIVALVAGQSLAVFGGDFPSVSSPLPLPLIVPCFLGVPASLVAVSASLILFGGNAKLLCASAETPERNVYIFLACVFLSVAYFMNSWSYGVKYQGRNYATVCLAWNVALFVFVAVQMWFARRAPSFLLALAVHTSFALWMVSFAFPYMGELP